METLPLRTSRWISVTVITERCRELLALPMADKAVETGKRIGVIATLPTTLEPTADLIRRRAAKAGKEIDLTSRVCEGAFDALMGGDAPKHDAMVAGALRELAAKVDVIVLAQASMARVLAGIPADAVSTPILSSPHLALAQVRSLLATTPGVTEGAG